MATAVQTSTPPGTPNPRLRLALTSLFVGLFVLGGLAVAIFLVPALVERAMPRPPAGQPDPFTVTRWLSQIVLQVVSAVGITWLGTRLAGSNPPRGLRGGVFLVVSVLIAVFFITRAIGLNLEESGFGLPITLVVLGALLAASYFFLTSPRAERWMHAIEDQGWLSAHGYKKSQGIRMRRYTLIGILLIGGSGVYSLVAQQPLGTGDWVLRIPYTGDPSLTLIPLTAIEYSVPVLLAALTIWFAWRAVNMPVFADFLVATEAEMNKVSWSSRRRLLQDTVVVLATVFLLTAFLLVMDVFWGWLLSRELVGVLPPRSNSAAPVDPTQGKRVDW